MHPRAQLAYMCVNTGDGRRACTAGMCIHKEVVITSLPGIHNAVALVVRYQQEVRYVRIFSIYSNLV